MTGPVRIDLHVHSQYSPDSRTSVEEIGRRLGRAGLSGFALTDHNSVEGHARLRAWGKDHPGYVLVPGVEVSTEEGHLLAFGVTVAPPAHRPITETIEFVRAQGGETVLPHPYRWRHGVGPRVAASARVGAIEVRNGHNGAVANARAELVASQRSLAVTGGSDAHSLYDLGRACTVSDAGIGSVDDLLDAIRHGRTLAEGASLSRWGQVRVGARTLAISIARGFRAI